MKIGVSGASGQLGKVAVDELITSVAENEIVAITRTTNSASGQVESHYGDYDRPETLFYLDPPYWGCETDYGPGFERGDFARLADLLSGLQGRFILSLNDVPEVRELFAWAKIDAIETTYTIGQNKGKKAGELVISTP